MEKHLLVTVSEQQSAFCGVRFVGHFFSHKEDLKLTFFYTAPKAPGVWEGESDHQSVAQSQQQAKEYEIKGRKAFEAARKELIQLGCKPDNIATKLQIRRFTKVTDIIQEAETGLYDAVVLGRRGLSWLEEAFDESVSKGILEKQVNFPLWLCRRPDPARKNLLLCVDGSDASKRMADHVGFMLAGKEQQEVTALFVKKSGATLKKDPDDILSESREIMTKSGIPAERIKSRIISNNNIGKAILAEVENGRFAAVAVGRTGAGQGFLQKLFMGSVSEKLFRELERAALWICH
jgi:nucleotide-binding universal stress UspA family protein